MAAGRRRGKEKRDGSGEEERKGGRAARAGLCTCLLDEVHEAGPEAPGLVAVALQGADRQLRGALGRHGHHVHGVVHQRCFCLRRHSPLSARPSPSSGGNLSGRDRGDWGAAKSSSSREFLSAFSTGRESTAGRGRSGGTKQAAEGL